jgi:hypothetical protein
VCVRACCCELLVTVTAVVTFNGNFVLSHFLKHKQWRVSFMLVIGDFVLLALYQGQGDPHSRIRVAKHAVVLTLEASLLCFMDSKRACQWCICSQWGCIAWLAFPYTVQVTVTHSHSLPLSLSHTHTHTSLESQKQILYPEVSSSSQYAI